jgi:hypothetical protein
MAMTPIKKFDLAFDYFTKRSPAEPPEGSNQKTELQLQFRFLPSSRHEAKAVLGEKKH